MYLQLSNLTKKFGLFDAVRDMTLDIERGQLVSILGPSGCGKTTTLNLIGGFVKPTAGRILLEGVDITGIPPHRRPTATVFQNYALFPHLNVINNVTYGLKFKGVAKRERMMLGEKMLEMVGLQSDAQKEIIALSGGEQQRVALARALVINPKVLLMDEPLSSLDAKLRVKMRKEIKDLQSSTGITTIYVTHDQEEALSISDQIVVMEQGAVSQVGSPREIYLQPRNRFVADFIGKVNIIEDSRGNVVLIRPEDVDVSEVSGQWPGKIVQKQYLGALSAYFISVRGSIIQADILSRADPDWKPGSSIYVTLPGDKALLLK